MAPPVVTDRVIATELEDIDLDTSRFLTILLVSTIVPLMAVTIM